MANIYQGPDSCYGMFERIYVPGRGVTARNVKHFIALILRDLRRGWTYDHQCRRIPMDKRLAEKRLLYLVPLAKRHTRDVKQVWAVREAVLDALAKIGATKKRAVLA
jgi:hypothetical protein